MDVDIQLEANGLPKQFDSSADQSQDLRTTANVAASVSNSETTVTSLPAKPAFTDLSQQPDQTKPVPEALPEASSQSIPALPPEDPVPFTNGTGDHSESLDKSLSVIPDSQPTKSADIPATNSAIGLPSDDNMTDSVVPSSNPAEVKSPATGETMQLSMETSAAVSAAPEQPISDLRSEPHADARSPEAVAEIEAEKHKLDNAADTLVAPAKPDVADSSINDSTRAESLAATDNGALNKTGLPSPPHQSPPPSPHPVHLVQVEEKRLEATPTPVAVDSTAESVEAPAAPVADPLAPTASPALQLEKPSAPAPTPAPVADVTSEDQTMTDAPAPAIKQAREREDDGEEQDRSAKRVKTDEAQTKSEESSFKVPDAPTVASQSPPVANGNSVNKSVAPDGDDSITTARLVHMKKVISNLKKSNASSAFRQPVDYLALNIPNYPDVVKHPMDLSTIDQRLKQNKYTSVSDFISDFQLIIDNCFAFNGPEHGVSQQAKKMQSSFNGQMANLPKAGVEEPTKEKKTNRKHEPTRQAPPRRPSVSTTTHPAALVEPSPKSAAPPTPSFAPGPDGIPLIRRDSTLTDGRPKRAIVPTKRNQEFGGGRPKKKKYELQLRFCDEVLKELMHGKNWQFNQYFTHPVDPVALNIPTYFQIIKSPMDLGTVKTKLRDNMYEKAKDFEQDIRLIFKNCYKFNPEGDLVNAAGHQLEELFNQKWATKDEWISAREPPSEPPTDADEEDDEEQDSEDEAAEDSDEERNDKIKQLQKQIELMSKQMGELTQKKPKKSKSPPTKKAKTKTTKKEKQSAGLTHNGKDRKEKKKPTKSKPDKDRYVTFAEKQYISNGIAMLPEKQMQEALKIIQQSVPSLANSAENEIELDIEEVPTHALLKLLSFVKKYAGPPPDELKTELQAVYSAPAATTTKSKKSKPMNKHEQEAQIEELKGKLGAYGGGMSPGAIRSIEGDESSDDDDNSEESEEE